MDKTGNLLAKLFSTHRADFKTNEKSYHFALGFRLQNSIDSLDKLELAYGFSLLETLIQQEKSKSVKKKLTEIKTVGIFSLYKEDSPQHKTIVS